MYKENYKDAYSEKIIDLKENPDCVVYYDLNAIKNGQQLVDYLQEKMNRLRQLGFSQLETENIILYGDELAKCLINIDHLPLFTEYIKNNMP
ncbi:MAG: hypothetical protein WCJ95_21320 [Mariniphaga sp.]